MLVVHPQLWVQHPNHLARRLLDPPSEAAGANGTPPMSKPPSFVQPRTNFDSRGRDFGGSMHSLKKRRVLHSRALRGRLIVQLG